MPALVTTSERAPLRPWMVPCGAVPDDPRAQLGEAVRRIAAVEHVEHVLQLFARELVEGLGGGDQALDRVDLPLVHRRHRDQVLGEHVERVLGDHRLLDLPFAHAPGDDRALEQVAAVFGEDPAFRGLAEPVPGAADPLQAAGHRLRRLDLDHEVDGAHVDSELERAGRDQAGELAGLEQLLDQGALLVGERAVMGAGDLEVRGRRGGGGLAVTNSGRFRRDLPLPSVAGVLRSGKLLVAFAVRKLVQALCQAL